MSRRVIRKNSKYCDQQAADLLQSLFAMELVTPSETLWLVSAWVSDVPIIDNTAEPFVGIDPEWGARWLRMSEVLVALAQRGCSVNIATNADEHNHLFSERLTSSAHQYGVEDRVTILERDDLHAKGLLGDDYHLHGSMNFTYNGIQVLAEQIILETDPDHVQRARLDYMTWFDSKGSSP